MSEQFYLPRVDPPRAEKPLDVARGTIRLDVLDSIMTWPAMSEQGFYPASRMVEAGGIELTS
jgi:hypothetical protein